MKNNSCLRFSHIDTNGNPVYKSKRVFDTDKDAIVYAKKVNVMNADHLIHKLVAYKCPNCGKWHIGRTTTLLSEKNREKLMKEKLMK